MLWDLIGELHSLSGLERIALRGLIVLEGEKFIHFVHINIIIRMRRAFGLSTVPLSVVAAAFGRLKHSF